MSQPSLLYIPGATEGTTQWRAEVLQLINWGGFHGHARMPLSRNSTLLSGASGTGKSTLLDAYLALMMPSDEPFNGASNDATTGRARGAEQRNLLSYLRGKRDTRREQGTDELSDDVLRGRDSATWGALSMTFIDDHERRFTVLRTYFVPRGVTRSAEISMRMATLDGFLDLRDLELLARSRFEKRALTSRWPDIKVYDTYAALSQTLFTRLGIGAGGDGLKALRLLARIQGNQQIRTVDELYKTMVLELPATYAAANLAVEHFTKLDETYEAMQTEAAKLTVLQPLPELYEQWDTAVAKMRMIDTFGIHREGDSPLLLWQARSEARLLGAAVDINRGERMEAKTALQIATDNEKETEQGLREVEEQQRANGGDVLASLIARIQQLQGRREAAEGQRDRFASRTAVLHCDPRTHREFVALQDEAARFLGDYPSRRGDLDDQVKRLADEGYPLQAQRNDLDADLRSLSGRKSAVHRHLHGARVEIATACGLDAEDLPFVAELIDMTPGEEQWRRAAEATLFSIARIILVDREKLEHLSRTIDPLKISYRVRFEGVVLRPYVESPADPRYISGKLVYKDSPFSDWVRQRVRRTGTDALCVDEPGQLRGEGLRVTRNGQTRDGSSGSHGELKEPHIIGFSNEKRIRQIEAEIERLDTALGALGRRERQLKGEIMLLEQRRDAYQYIADCDWPTVDVDGIETQIRELEKEHDRLLASSNILVQLQARHDKLAGSLEDARRVRYGAERRRDDLDNEHGTLAIRQDRNAAELDRLEQTQATSLSDAHTDYLNVVFAKVGNEESLADFRQNVGRLRRRLADESAEARNEHASASQQLQRIFEEYQRTWKDPNLGTSIESYQGYRTILDRIVSTGLHERRQEWRRRLADWSGEDLVPLNGAFDTAIEDIEDRLDPVNTILENLPFGPAGDRLRISLRRLHRDDITNFRRELKELSSGVTQDVPDDQLEQRFIRLRDFIKLIRPPEPGTKAAASRDAFLDVRKHVEMTAVRTNRAGVEVATYASLGDKSGGETQELIAFIVGAALRFQLGDEDRARPRFAPVFLDEGFIKADSQYAGRAVNAWLGLGFQLMVSTPFDKVPALEPYMELILVVTKTDNGYSYIRELRSTDAQS